MNKSNCAGCKDDFYNGKNGLGVKECFRLRKARLVLKKRVGINQTPPWKQKPVKVPDCYREKGFVYVNKDVVC